MSEDNGNNGKKRPLTQSEKFKNYCLGIAALTALILGTFNILKGEPTAQKAWETSQEEINKTRKNVNRVGESLRKLHLMFVHMQGQQEGYNNAKLLQKIEKLEKASESPKDPQPKISQVSKKPCPPGWVRIDDRCTKSRTKIAKAAKAAVMETRMMKKKLELERVRREAAERARAQAQQIRLPEPAPPSLPPVPKKLDDASKLEK